MGNTNVNLCIARSAHDDEFYTTYETIESELIHYKDKFIGKIVLCNCDDPFESNFCKFFLKNFNSFALKKLICTSYGFSKGSSVDLFTNNRDEEGVASDGGYVLETEKFSNEKGVLPDEIIDDVLHNPKIVRRLDGDGDFRSRECIGFLKQCDVVVTNPPFSLFKEFVAEVMKHDKKFLLIGNQNALTYKEIFPLIQKNKVWTGYHFGEMNFKVPDSSGPRSTRYWVDEDGQKWRSLGNAMWLTNLDNENRHKLIKMNKPYNEVDHPKYDNYDAINIKTINDIPYDYPGIMGVPITFINRFNCEQFEIVGEANHGSDSEFDLFKPIVSGKEIFKRILIKNKNPQVSRKRQFNVLDLFCGAGGFSFGMEKNVHFRTKIALDFNRQALETFKKNMPDTETIFGDITDEEIKKKVIALSTERKINMIIGGPPCQGFSLKGKKLGLNDPRNYLFKEYLDIVEAICPDVFVIENVKSLLSTSSGWFKDQIIERVRAMGYFVSCGVLTASDFGVPQSRQRAVFICSREKEIPLPTGRPEHIVTVRDAISDLSYLNSGEGAYEQEYSTKAETKYQAMMRRNCKKLYNHKASRHSSVAIKKLGMIPAECGKEYLPKDLLGKQQFSGTWGRLKWDCVSPTIDTRFDAASNGTNNHPFLNRAITPREAARLQSFSDEFVFTGNKICVRTQIGNAVPPLLAKAIADKIFEEMGDLKK